jgi:sarcosine oxidase subunit gamma
MSNSNVLQTSPLVQIDFAKLGTNPSVLMIKEHAFLSHVNIRGDSDNPTFMSKVRSVLKVALPIEANTFVEANGNTILWLGPDEWLVITDADNCIELVASLKSKLKTVSSAITDVSGANTILELSGEKAQALLLKGCPLDLHHSEFSVGQCAQTVIAKTSMTLWQTNEGPVYKLIVRRSFADYLGLWLLDAAREYQDI